MEARELFEKDEIQVTATKEEWAEVLRQLNYPEGGYWNPAALDLENGLLAEGVIL